jgi:hypothetical protein
LLLAGVVAILLDANGGGAMGLNDTTDFWAAVALLSLVLLVVLVGSLIA